jgi:rhamnopyranosyl-N-acetylglucosaminyl-diphospho-decaprenol beta-1,3/1,4-galactofuranosyltransferase
MTLRDASSLGSSGQAAERVAVVVVTFNRADLLERMLSGLDAMDRRPDCVVVVNNTSTDHTREVLERATNPDLVAIHTTDNLGGAGGFHLGLKAAYDKGFDAMWLMDDDVVPAPDCLTRLLEVDNSCLTAVREDLTGALVEKAAVRFDLRNPLSIRPKKASIDSTYADRTSMPATVPVENVSFEGFLVRREVIDAIGLPDPSYFIFYDDVDFAIRARRAGYEILAVRDAVLVRQLDFDQQHDLAGWKGYYMYRNLFAVHFRYGENALVRLKPWLVALVVVVLSPLRGGRAEARNVSRALRDARGMRTLPGPPG